MVGKDGHDQVVILARRQTRHTDGRHDAGTLHTNRETAAVRGILAGFQRAIRPRLATFTRQREANAQ